MSRSLALVLLAVAVVVWGTVGCGAPEPAEEERAPVPMPEGFGVRLVPAADPAGEPWRLRVFDVGEPSLEPPLVAETAVEEGVWDGSALAPGHYLLEVWAGAADERWLTRRAVVGPYPKPLVLRLSGVPVTGRLAIGPAPFVGRLVLEAAGEGEKGATAEATVTLDTDPLGAFDGLLPAPGSWRVTLREAEGTMVLRLAEPFTVEHRKSAARLDVVLPETAIEGRVVSPRGAPQAGILVEALVPDRPQAAADAVSDGTGRYRFRGLTPGPVRVRAEEGEAEDHVDLVLGPRGEATLRDLVLEAPEPVPQPSPTTRRRPSS